MSSTPIDIAEALAVALNAGDFSEDFTASWEEVIDNDLRKGDINDLQVLTLAASLDASTYDRVSDQHDSSIFISIQKKIDPKTRRAAVKSLSGFVQELMDYVLRLELPSVGAQVVSVQNSPLYDGEQLRDNGAYVSLITVLYRTVTG